MFVSKAKYRKVCEERDRALFRVTSEINDYNKLALEYNVLLKKAKELKERLAIAEQGSNQGKNLTKDDIKRLIALCHPDKHNNSEMATKMTQKLLEIR